MAGTYDVAVLVGSLRRDSINRKVARSLIELAPSALRLEIVGIGELPLYNSDSEQAVPATWAAFRARLEAAQAMLFVTPEYNRSIPAPLKNAIDVGSRPFGHSVFAHKPAAVVSASTGALGAFGANQHLRQTFVFLDVYAMAQPEAYLGHADKLFDEGGKLANDGTRKFLEGFMTAFATWIERFERRAA